MVRKRKTRLPWDWKNRLVLIRQVTDIRCLEFVLCFRKGTTPKGYMRKIGHFIVEYDNRVHSEIDHPFRNRGLGFMCYRAILHELGELKTCYHYASPPARSVWRKLVECYPHKKEFWSSILTIKAKGKFSGIEIIEEDK